MSFKLKILVHFIIYKIRGRFPGRAALQAFQRKRLRRYVKAEFPLAPYYRRFADLDLDNWTQLPIMDKEQMMAAFSDLNIAGISRDEAIAFAVEAEKGRNFSPELNGITIGLSTGTSGRQGIFMASENERAQWTAMMMIRVLKPSVFKKQRIAFFLRANSNLYSSIRSRLFDFSYFDIFRPMPELLAQLQQYQPHILAAQPSVLMEVCRQVRQGKLAIRPGAVISFAEVLHHDDKKYIEATLHVAIREVYQCMEGFLGCTCAHGTMHLNEDIVYIEKEFIDDTRFYPVITDFTRTTQAMVRYRLNDVLKLKKDPCACGSSFTALECIEGRSDDVLLFRNRQGAVVRLFPDVLSRKIAWSAAAFEQYQVAQTSWTQMSIAIVSAADQYEATQHKIDEVLTDWLAENDITGVTIDHIPALKHIQGNKFRKIQRLFSYNQSTTKT